MECSYKLFDSKQVFRSSFLSVSMDRVTDIHGKVLSFDVVRKKPVVVIVPIHSNQTIELVKQYRHPVEHEVWEVPAGHIDPGENEDQAAARELKEETGLVAEKLICMGKYFTSPGFTDEAMTFFLALGLTRGPRIVVEGENDIVLDRFSFEAAWLLASKDLKTATGLLMAKDFLQAREDENAAEELGG